MVTIDLPVEEGFEIGILNLVIARERTNEY